MKPKDEFLTRKLYCLPIGTYDFLYKNKIVKVSIQKLIFN